MKANITFTKLNVIWADLMIIAVLGVSIVMGEYMPVAIACLWVGYWLARLVLTAVLHTKKKGRKQKYTFFEGIAPYINEDNATALIEKYVGIEPKYNKGKKGDK